MHANYLCFLYMLLSTLSLILFSIVQPLYKLSYYLSLPAKETYTFHTDVACLHFCLQGFSFSSIGQFFSLVISACMSLYCDTGKCNKKKCAAGGGESQLVNDEKTSINFC